MSNKIKIKKELDKLKDPREIHRVMKERQSRLKSLVHKYGLEDVALAAGYTVSTLAQYIRVTNVPTIGEESVRQAEVVLNKL